MNVNESNNLDHIDIEEIGVSNPLNINLNNIGEIVGLEIEQFNYTPPGNSVGNPSFLGVQVEGLKGCYNSKGAQISTIKTIPLVGGSYTFNTDDPDLIRYGGNNSNLTVTFMNRESISNLNPSVFTFNNNYLFKISLYIKRK